MIVAFALSPKALHVMVMWLNGRAEGVSMYVCHKIINGKLHATDCASIINA